MREKSTPGTDNRRDTPGSWVDVYRSRRVLVMPLLGFASGLPLSLTGSTLQAWLATTGIDIRTIAIFALVGIPYTLKFLWSPLMDRYVPPLLGRRRGWMVITQLLLMAAITALGLSSPQAALPVVAALALMVAFLSASQDIVVDAYRTDVLGQKERGAGAGIFLAGYRAAMLVSGALALILSAYLGWAHTYLLMALLMMVGPVTTLFSPEPLEPRAAPRSLQEAVWGPLKDFFAREQALVILLLIILYKLGDAYAGTLTTAFLLRGPGFSVAEVGTVNKGLGMISTILGAMAGGTMMMRLGLFRSLLFFGILQGVSNLSFVVLALAGKSYLMLFITIAFENLAGGMGSTALVALIMAVCNPRYSATQFALLSSLAVLGRFVVSPTAGYLVEALGWAPFFTLTTIAALPGLILLVHLKQRVIGLEQVRG